MMKLKLTETIKDWWRSLEKYSNSNWILSMFWLAFICGLAFLWNLGSIGLIDETEPLFAEAARQMTVTGDWITPYFNGATRFDKPPLIYWLMAICYKLIGVNEWAVRLPSALAAIALTIFCFFTLRYFGFATPAMAQSPQQATTQRQLWLSAWIGAALVAFNVQTLAWARQGVSDMLLSSCMGMALFCFFWGYANQLSVTSDQLPVISEEFRSKYFPLSPLSSPTPPLSHSPTLLLPNRWYLGFYILSALAVLTKGPIGIVIPGLIIISFVFYVGKLREVLQEMRVIIGGLIFLAICVPWYILVTLKNGDAFINSFFGYHNVERFTSVVNNHSAPWYFYFLIVLGLFAPWSIYLPVAIARLHFWKRSFWKRQSRQAHLGLFALIWFVDIFVFFTISVTKLPSYVLPLIPAAAILVSLVWSEELSRSFDEKYPKRNAGFKSSIIFNIILLIILSVACFLIPSLVGSDTAMQYLSELIKQSGVPLWGGTIWAIAAIASSILFIKSANWRWIIGVNIAAFIAFIIFFLNPAYSLMDVTRQLPLRELSEVIKQVKQPEEQLMMIGFKKPSVTFYTQQKVGFFWTIDEPATEFLKKIVSSSNASTILMLGQPKEIAETGLRSQDYQVLGKQSPYQLIRVGIQKVLNLKN
jgi:4-amino-4-deoxy-L-arabinose transferase-like glycosyltransferase